MRAEIETAATREREVCPSPDKPDLVEGTAGQINHYNYSDVDILFLFSFFE